MAEERLIEMVIISASNLKDVNYISKMETYAVLTFPPYVEYTTQVDSKGALNPQWNEKFGFLVPESVIQRGDNHLKVEIYTLSTLGPKFVSEASIPLSDLSNLLRSDETMYRRYPLKTNSGDYHGDLYVSFSVGEKVVLQKGEPPSYPIVTKFVPPAPSIPPSYDYQHPSYPTPTPKPPQARFDLGPPPSTPTKPSKFSKPTLYGSDDTQFQPPSRTPPSTPPPPPSFDIPPPSTYRPLPSRPIKPTPPSSSIYVEPPFPSKPHTLPETYDTFPTSYVSPPPSKPQKPLPQPTRPSAFTQPPPHGPYEGGESLTYSPITSPRPPPKLGTPSMNVPISIADEYPTKYPSSFDQSDYGQANGYGYQVPTSSLSLLFGGPLGRVLLTELGKNMVYDRQY